MKSNKGITLLILVITIVLILIVGSTVLYNSIENTKAENVTKMYNDILLLEEKINIYYAKYSLLPTKYEGNGLTISAYDVNTIENFENVKNINDNENYYIIDLTKINNLTLNYGHKKDDGDIYIVNEQSHTVYYVNGIKYKGEMYHKYPRSYTEVVDR